MGNLKEISYQPCNSKEVLCDSQFDATKAHSSGYNAPYSLGDGWARTLTFEFESSPKGDITFMSE